MTKRGDHLLCTKDGLETFVGLLVFMGAMCPQCGYGTRVTSKRWARCKQCGERVRRRRLEELEEPSCAT